MLKSTKLEVIIDGKTAKWYRSRGYEIPTHKRQCYAMVNGRKIRNGCKIGVKRGTKIIVDVKDLLPGSSQIIEFICETCNGAFTTTWYAHKEKISNNCKSCQAKKGFKGGCQDYWTDTLVKNDPSAKCDISGETDKRFLELHHLLSRKNGGLNEASNYVILSANYHRAFHNWMRGSNVLCTPEDYYRFKEIELKEKLRAA